MTRAADIPREDAAWLAGLLDGEGCFDAPRGNPRIRVKMTDLDVILRAADVMDASTYGEVDHRRTVTGGERSPLMVAQVSGDKAIAVMRAVLPWMGARRAAKITELIVDHAAKKKGKVRLLRVSTPDPTPPTPPAAPALRLVA